MVASFRKSVAAPRWAAMLQRPLVWGHIDYLLADWSCTIKTRRRKKPKTGITVTSKYHPVWLVTPYLGTDTAMRGKSTAKL